MDAGQFTVDVIDDNQSNVKMYKAELKGGGTLPDWITIDPETGEVIRSARYNKYIYLHILSIYQLFLIETYCFYYYKINYLSH